MVELKSLERVSAAIAEAVVVGTRLVRWRRRRIVWQRCVSGDAQPAVPIPILESALSFDARRFFLKLSRDLKQLLFYLRVPTNCGPFSALSRAISELGRRVVHVA